jgi:hypothetical protein
MKRIGNIGINTTFIIKKPLFKNIVKDENCQKEINKEIEGKHEWLQLNNIIQSIKGKGISTLLGKIQTKEVIIKIQEANEAKKEYDIQNELKYYNGFINFECLFYCDGDKKYIESFGNLEEKRKLCRAKGITMGIILMPYYKNGSIEKYIIYKNIIEKVLKNYLYVYNDKGFVHSDFFPKNIILDDNMNPIIIDFEKSYYNINKNDHTYFWRDLTDFISYIKYEKDLSDIIRKHCMLNGAYNNKPTNELIDNLIKDL